MKLLITIAWRNLYRHRGKSLVIGTILFLGAFLLTLGNAVISGMEKGLDKSIVDGFTGDAILVSDKQIDNSVLIGMMGRAVEDIPRFDSLRPHLENSGLFKQLLPVGKSFAMAINEQGGMPGYVFLLGVNFKDWRKMFPNSLSIEQGIYPDSTGLLMSHGGLKELYNNMGIWFSVKGQKLDSSLLSDEAKSSLPLLNVQEDIVFMGFNASNTASDIRLSVDGISKFKSLNKIWGFFIFVDIANYRNCMGHFSESTPVKLNETQKTLLLSDNENLDALFGTDLGESEDSVINTDTSLAKPLNINENSNPESGLYSLVFSRFHENLNRQWAIDSLQKYLKAHNIPLRALSWQEASGPIGSLALLIKAALNVFVFFLFFVAIIIIVNTMSMAAMERTTEIGMMRAVGAQKSFITRMFLFETGFLAFLFGALGIAIGAIVVLIVQNAGISTNNEILQLFYGGDTFHPIFGLGDFLLTLIQISLVTILASLYPMKVAKSITPLDAISRD